MALTVESIFNAIMALDNERDLIDGGDEVARGLIVVAMVTKWLEAEAAVVEGVLATHDLLYTAANTETTDWPAELARLDALWMVDENTGRPIYKIEKIQGVGNHVPGFKWPYSELVNTGVNVTGRPREYVGTGPGGQFYWACLPDAEYWVRAYGLWIVPDNFYTDRDSAFPYPSLFLVPFASMCSQVFRTGLERDLSAIEALAKSTFRTVLKGLKRFDQSEPESRVYSEIHDA